MRDRIAQAATRLVTERGIGGWSIQGVAERTPCAKALVIHYYGSRTALLEEVGRRIGRTRSETRLGALRASGTSGLDRLWQVIVSDARSGLSRATFAIQAEGYQTRGAEDAAIFRDAVARGLGIPAEAVADPLALAAMLEGIEIQLLRGADTELVRAAFDRLWLSVIEG